MIMQGFKNKTQTRRTLKIRTLSFEMGELKLYFSNLYNTEVCLQATRFINFEQDQMDTPCDRLFNHSKTQKKSP